ncbi:acyl CoA:acetate/3-ketoacid CoA transferase [Brachybacterium sp.]|uniref:acyl CoA:acetate/3-ketoacid CoA transferase n=1 Tax=Brachybacterium sp. TaxID=1891286 RepID=UPI003F91FCFB
MTTTPRLTPREVADLIHDGDVVTVSASSGLGCPDAILAAIGERFQETGAPRDLTTVHPMAAGDMSGIEGMDHIAVPGLLRRVIAGSLPSGPSSAPPPRIWQLITGEEIDAYNIPTGALYQMHRAGASRQPGVLSKVGLDIFVDPRHQGARMNDVTPEGFVELVELGDEEWLRYPPLTPDVAVLRATTADENGNLSYEEEASRLAALDLAYATHNSGGIVIAQVKQSAARGSLPAQQVHVPGVLVDAVVVVPDQMQTTGTLYDPAISGQQRRPLSTLDPIPFSLEKIIARRAALELHAGEAANLGFGVSALIPHVLLEEGEERAVDWVLEHGPIGGVPLLDFVFGVSHNPDAIVTSSDQFTLLQGGGCHHAFVSFLEIDSAGSVNVHYLPHRRHVSVGIGGFADITSAAPEIVFVGSFTAGRRDIRIVDGALDIREDGPHTKFVSRVHQSSFSGAKALENGQRIRYVTERAVLELRENGLTVTEIAPGVDLEKNVLARSDAPLTVADDLEVMDQRLFHAAPFGLHLTDRAPHGRLLGHTAPR